MLLFQVESSKGWALSSFISFNISMRVTVSRLRNCFPEQFRTCHPWVTCLPQALVVLLLNLLSPHFKFNLKQKRLFEVWSDWQPTGILAILSQHHSAAAQHVLKLRLYPRCESKRLTLRVRLPGDRRPPSVQMPEKLHTRIEFVPEL